MYIQIVRALLKTETLLVSKAIRISNLIPRVLSVVEPQSERERDPGPAYSLSTPLSLSLSLSPSLSLTLRAENGENPGNEDVFSAGLAY